MQDFLIRHYYVDILFNYYIVSRHLTLYLRTTTPLHSFGDIRVYFVIQTLDTIVNTISVSAFVFLGNKSNLVMLSR